MAAQITQKFDELAARIQANTQASLTAQMKEISALFAAQTELLSTVISRLAQMEAMQASSVRPIKTKAPVAAAAAGASSANPTGVAEAPKMIKAVNQYWRTMLMEDLHGARANIGTADKTAEAQILEWWPEGAKVPEAARDPAWWGNLANKSWTRLPQVEQDGIKSLHQSYKNAFLSKDKPLA